MVPFGYEGIPRNKSFEMTKILFLLVDAKGESYKGSGTTFIEAFEGMDVDDFKGEVKKESAPLLNSFGARQLRVYQNKDDLLNENTLPLLEDLVVDGLGASHNEALLILVPPDNTVAKTTEKDVSEVPTRFGFEGWCFDFEPLPSLSSPFLFFDMIVTIATMTNKHNLREKAE